MIPDLLFSLHPVPDLDAAATNAVFFYFLFFDETRALLQHLQLLFPHNKENHWLSLHAAIESQT